MSKKNISRFSYQFVTREEFLPQFKELRPTVFSENNDVNYSIYWTNEELEKNKILQEKFDGAIRYYLFCRDGEKIVGWSCGYQKDSEEFYMVNSAVMPEYRELGIYTNLLNKMIEKAKVDGFQIISSIHHASNNGILIPKLKAGFKVVGMKLSPRFGTLLELHFYTNEKVGQVLDYRTGFSKVLP